MVIGLDNTVLWRSAINPQAIGVSILSYSAFLFYCLEGATLRFPVKLARLLKFVRRHDRQITRLHNGFHPWQAGACDEILLNSMCHTPAPNHHTYHPQTHGASVYRKLSMFSFKWPFIHDKYYHKLILNDYSTSPTAAETRVISRFQKRRV